MLHIFIGIETCPTSDEGVIADIEAGVSPPGNITKVETIEKWWHDKGSAALAHAVGRTAFDAACGEVISIGVALDFGEPAHVLLRDPGAGDPGDAEAAVLRRFTKWVRATLEEHSMVGADGRTLFPETPVFVGHNVAGFDLPFLWRRMAVHGVSPRGWRMPSLMSMKAGRDYMDTMQMWAGLRDRVSLRTLALAFGLDDTKQGGDGGQCWQWWRAGDVDRLRGYCAGDVETPRMCGFA